MYSFDVFDTLICRATITPHGVFGLMQEKLKMNMDTFKLSSGFVDNFVLLRIDAEKNARKFSGVAEVSLRDIYDALKMMTDITDEQCQALMNLEFQCEKMCVVGISQNIERVKYLLEAGEKVVLISDMYLSAGQIRELLVQVDEVFTNLPIYVSSECGCTKYNGLLYQHVHTQEQVEKSEWTHCGDNLISDVNSAKQFGIKTELCKSETLYPWERYLLDTNTGNNTLLQLVLGTARKVCAKKTQPAFRIGATCGAMILLPYVIWLINRSMNMGISRLYFVARDGYILKQIADVYIREYGLDIKTYYLYGSRMAWKTSDVEKQQLIIEYFEQMMDGNYSDAALVDTHGTGQSINMVAGLIDKRLKVFCYNLLESPKDKFCEFMVYAADGHMGMIELFCRAPHGATLCYERVENRIEPKLEACNKKAWEGSNLHEYSAGVLALSEELIPLTKKFGIRLDLTAMGRALLAYCAHTPDDYIAEFIGNIQHDANNEDGMLYAPKLTNRDLCRMALLRTCEDKDSLCKCGSIDYSLTRLPAKERAFFCWCNSAYSGLVGKILHLPKKMLKEVFLHKKAERIAIYAAGYCGKELYRSLLYKPGIRVVNWVDANYKAIKKQGYKVNPIHTLHNTKYDYILIAIENNVELTNSIRDMLIAAGIPADKIRTSLEGYKK